MAVFVEIDDDERDEIISRYGLSRLLSVFGIVDGDSETTYLFRTEKADLIVTIFEDCAEQANLERTFNVMGTLSQNGIPCPMPIRSLKGEAAIQIREKLVAVVSFVDGSTASVVNAEHCFDLGRIVARIHSCLRTVTSRGKAVLDVGLVHGALTRDNVFFLNSRVSGIINFRMHHKNILVSELANMIAEWTLLPDITLNVVNAQALVDGYCSERPLSVQERDALPGFVMSSVARLSAIDSHHLPDIAVHAFQAARKIVIPATDRVHTA